MEGRYMAFEDEERMEEHVKPHRLQTQVLAPTQSVPSWMVSALDIDRAIETLSTQLGRAPVEIEVAEALHTSLADYRRILENFEGDDSYTNEDAAEEKRAMAEEMKHWTPSEGWPQYDRSPEPEVSADWLPPGTAAPEATDGWTISAPDIEHAIRRLYAKCDHAPTEAEIAKEMRVDITLYRETLNYLKDLEVGLLYAEHTTDSEEEWLAYSPNGTEGEVLFRCLRSEMRGLFRNAVCNLPRMERLVITLTYSEGIGDKSLSAILELPESTISNIRTSAWLHLRASLPNPHLQTRPRVRGLLSAPSGRNASAINEEGATIRGSDHADITVYGSQDGSLPTGQSWESLGKQASWNRDFRSWYSVDDEKRLTQIRRKETYQLKLEL
jgi:DNA-directed RNA polymerase specialized sigma subunit